MTLTWVVGRGGLLGSHVETAVAESGSGARIWRPEAAIDWSDIKTALSALRSEVTAIFRRVPQTGERWQILWCAGAGVVATSPVALAQETRLVAGFLDMLSAELANDASLAPSGMLFFASSAGGVYASSTGSLPFDETSPVRPLAPYGREKLVQEDLFARMAGAHALDLLVGRFSNLYGPGQKLSKPQGLIAHVGRAALRRQPVSIYVPLDTIRDYLFAADAGRMVAEVIRSEEGSRRLGDASPGVAVKIFASEVETTVATVLGAWRQALRRPLRIALASNPVGQLQPRVLSFRSRVRPEVRGQPTLLPLGIDAVRRDQLARLLVTGVD
jgi:UDP-glucose 4-epimerase